MTEQKIDKDKLARAIEWYMEEWQGYDNVSVRNIRIRKKEDLVICTVGVYRNAEVHYDSEFSLSQMLKMVKN